MQQISYMYLSIAKILRPDFTLLTGTKLIEAKTFHSKTVKPVQIATQLTKFQ